jgi:CRP-like cAMP-binding protein/phosphoribosyl 1,2-cyclic phosphodiesterase
MACGVPKILVIGEQFFSYSRGITLADVEFPIFFNFFIRQQRCTVICTEAQKERVKQFMQESMFGPLSVEIDADVQGRAAEYEWCPDLIKEMDYFSQNPFKPGHRLEFDDFIEFATFDSTHGTVDAAGLTFRRTEDGRFEVYDPGADKRVFVDRDVALPPRLPEPARLQQAFERPIFGVSVLGRGHGFDPNTKTTGFILWANGHGILVDPPVDSTEYLKAHEVPVRATDAIILTHCHADHCGGTLQKALQADRIRLYTTPTIYASFLRKAQAITGLPIERFESILDYRPVPIHKPVYINGAEFVFNYTLHSIPCIQIEARLGGKSLVYSSDTLNDPAAFRSMQDAGAMSPGRVQDLLNFPWHHDLIVHEAGVPPIHTSTSILAELSDDIKSRMYLVHTTQSAIPEGSGLRLAPLGLENTLQLEAARPPHRNAIEWIRAMRSVDHFQGMSAEKAVEFLEVAQYRRVAAGEPLIKTGEPGNEFFMILSGKCAIYHGEVKRKVFGMYDYFGETALVGGGVRTADVTAISDMELLVMERHAFLDFLRGTPVVATMQRLYASRDLGTWRILDQHPILRDLNSTQRTRLQAMLEPCSFESGERLLTRFEAGPSSFILLEGRVESDDGQVFDAVGALITDIEAVTHTTPTSITFTARTAVKAVRIPCAGFQDYLLAYPGLYLRLLHND